ncbi:type II toxin-antitoxin system RelE/ParE family toxin [Acerihabitans sp. TG2]|uniref:type II toxin-antitoxin system RelE/ParE family toxin n=1 Tax=Acerihabitans sp. TG2 TaxID=3096008 RepID=UPI002B224EBA|nr:type II toxin-antitoxin system RelE/ParE family toxin [Acerihabitans sp. TG2]MEA9389306.1 type II toxin-antitoxin system RelE/ParE family toxin [Acerihabitans sp. TG2]
MWEVNLTETFKEWLLAQEKGLKKRIAASLLNLQQYGPSLPRPYADTVKGSQYPNMKELRVQHAGHPVRAFYVFDPERRAIVLCTDDKSYERQLYNRMISRADEVFSRHLDDMKRKDK